MYEYLSKYLIFKNTIIQDIYYKLCRSKKQLTLMNSKPEPPIWLHDTAQRIPCFDRCQLTITRMSSIKASRMAAMLGTSIEVCGHVKLVTLAYMKGWTYGHTVTKTKFSCTDGLPYFLTNGALHAWSSTNVIES